jgi:hypothetical protein
VNKAGLFVLNYEEEKHIIVLQHGLCRLIRKRCRYTVHKEKDPNRKNTTKSLTKENKSELTKKEKILFVKEDNHKYMGGEHFYLKKTTDANKNNSSGSITQKIILVKKNIIKKFPVTLSKYWADTGNFKR